MIPIIGCSILSLAIIAERLWMLRESRVAPTALVAQSFAAIQRDDLDPVALRKLRAGSALGRVIASGVSQRHLARPALLERIEESGRQETHELDRYLNTLGTIAAITPLLGLLGTVIGMIDVFTQFDRFGDTPQDVLAGGIGEALITTSAGLIVAIPSLVAFRYLRGRVKRLALDLERHALKLVDALEDVK